MSIVSCYIIVNADTTIDEDFDRHQRIQITTADYSSVHLLLPTDHTAAAAFLNSLITTCARLIDHIRQPHEPDTVTAEPAGATSSAHTDPPHTLQPGPHERLKRGQTSCSNSSAGKPCGGHKLGHRSCAPADNVVQAGQAACRYSCTMPPRRSCRRMSRLVMCCGSVIGAGTARSGAAWCIAW
jgi:hypothetical protein